MEWKVRIVTGLGHGLPIGNRGLLLMVKYLNELALLVGSSGVLCLARFNSSFTLMTLTVS